MFICRRSSRPGLFLILFCRLSAIYNRKLIRFSSQVQVRVEHKQIQHRGLWVIKRVHSAEGLYLGSL